MQLKAVLREKTLFGRSEGALKIPKRRIATIVAAVVAGAAPHYAAAQGPVVAAAGRVTFIEATYMPRVIVFSIKAPFGRCPAGRRLAYTGQGVDAAAAAQNAEAVFSLLLTAKTSGHNVVLMGDAGSCKVQTVSIS
jgi:hypothetical protein